MPVLLEGPHTFHNDTLVNLTQDGRKGLVFSYNVLNLQRMFDDRFERIAQIMNRFK